MIGIDDVRAQVAELYRRYGAMVHRRALWTLGNEADANEVLQDVFASLLERPASSRVSALSLYSVNTNASLKRLRDLKNRSRLLRESVAAGPARMPLAFEDAVRLRQALERLPAQLAEVAVYHFIDELSHEDIARVLGCSLRTVGNLWQRIVDWGRAQQETGGTAFLRTKLTRPPECRSDLRLDQWRAQELDEADALQLTQHVAGCERCRQRQLLHDQARERFEATLAPVPEWLARASEAKTRTYPWRRLALVSLLIVCLGSYPFLLKLPRSGGSSARGLPFISYYVERGGEAQRGVDAQVVYPGERLRFAYTAGTPQYLAILSLDGVARASVYYPSNATRAASVSPGSDVLLPGAVTLDATLGETSIVALFCERSFELEPMRVQLELEWSNLRAPAGCSTQELHVTKRSSDSRPGLRTQSQRSR